MCGIAGELRLDAPPDREATERMSAALVHRGPDAEGLWAEGPVVLGHRRLSVLDLAGGAQPMGREGVVLVFNGEAYDFASLRRELELRGHLFSSRSDTEVVLAAYLEWGEDFVRHVHGMFALALWDGRTRRLVLARDRFGKKPLYLAVGRCGTLGKEEAGRIAWVSGSFVRSYRAFSGSTLVDERISDSDSKDLLSIVQILAVQQPRTAPRCRDHHQRIPERETCLTR